MQPSALVAERVEQVRLDPAVQHRVGRLVDQERHAHVAQDRRRPAGVARVSTTRCRRTAPCLTRTRARERTHRLLQRRVGIEAVGVEDVDVVEPEPAEALVEAGQQVLARAAVAVRPRPHVPAGLGRDDQLVAERREVAAQEAAEVLLGRAVRRPVVVGQVEVGDAEVEGAPDDGRAGVRAGGRGRSCATARATRPAGRARCARSGGTPSCRNDRRRARSGRPSRLWRIFPR